MTKQTSLYMVILWQHKNTDEANPTEQDAICYTSNSRFIAYLIIIARYQQRLHQLMHRQT